MSVDRNSVWEAAKFAATAHANQKRGGKGVPYVTHVMDVARRVESFGVTAPVVLCGALLHDTVEDTAVTIPEIEKFFDPEVALIVGWLTLPKSIGDDYVAKTKHQSDVMKQMNDSGRIIKIADKWSNVADLITDPPSWGRNAYLGYANDAATVIRAGMEASKSEAVHYMGIAALKSVDDVVRRYG